MTFTNCNEIHFRLLERLVRERGLWWYLVIREVGLIGLCKVGKM